jgi:PadR family transcriptional regulator AphA
MAVADDQHPGAGQPGDTGAGGAGLSLAEWTLLCLVREGPTYGLVLAGLLARDGRLGQIWWVSKPTVYLVLKRLEVQGLIRTAEERSSQGPVRTRCEVTRAGAAAAQAWLGSPVEHPRDVRSELMVKLALHDRTGADASPLVRAQAERLLPVAAAIDDQLRAATGFDRTLLLWRSAATKATMRFLTDLAGSQPARTRLGRS